MRPSHTRITAFARLVKGLGEFSWGVDLSFMKALNERTPSHRARRALPHVEPEIAIARLRKWIAAHLVKNAVCAQPSFDL
jgi:hypothetical protein